MTVVRRRVRQAVLAGGMTWLVLATGQPAAVHADPATGGTWTRRTPSTSPTGRMNAATAYDAARQRVVLFGGHGALESGPPGGKATGYLTDTWTWDGDGWTRHSPPVSPPEVYLPAMAYDAVRGETVLYAGEYGYPSYLSETWTWNGAVWTKETPAASPPGRIGAALAYDHARGETVLFGGSNWMLGGARADTWTWDGSTWTKRNPATSPPPQYDARMAYDAARGEVVLFAAGQAGGFATDTWTWDGVTWTKRNPAVSPPERYNAAIAYDAARGRVVLAGGYGYSAASNSYDYVGDTWLWDGTTWTQDTPLVAPVPAREAASLAFHAAAGHLVLFGGYYPRLPEPPCMHGYFDADNRLDDTWTYQESVVPSPPGAPPAGAGGAAGDTGDDDSGGDGGGSGDGDGGGDRRQDPVC